jgi:hypothetical protein
MFGPLQRRKKNKDNKKYTIIKIKRKDLQANPEEDGSAWYQKTSQRKDMTVTQLKRKYCRMLNYKRMVYFILGIG